MDKIKHLRSVIPFEVFEVLDFHLANRDISREANYSLLSRMLKKGDIKKVARGLYVFDNIWRRKPLSKFNIANKLVSPSYVSLESALSHHGLIPESVIVTTSATTKRENKSFQTPFGDFSYAHIPVKNFSLGIESLSSHSGTQLIASPIKALFDLVYVRRKTYLSLSDIESDLRIDIDTFLEYLQNSILQDIEELASNYKKQTCMALLAVLKKEIR